MYSASVLAEVSVRSPRIKLFSLSRKIFFWIEVSIRVFSLILKTEALLMYGLADIGKAKHPEHQIIVLHKERCRTEGMSRVCAY